MRVEHLWKAAALALGLWSSPALAGGNCSKLPPEYRDQCEQAMKAHNACAGKQGEALKACQKKEMLSGATGQDCSKQKGQKKTDCENQKRAMEANAACQGKTGKALKDCVMSATAKSRPSKGHGGGDGEEAAAPAAEQ